MPLPLLCCLLGLGATIIIGIIGALLNRSITQIDKKIDDNCTAVSKLSGEMKGYEMLAKHLAEKNEKLETKVEVLTESHARIDKFIAVQVALHKVHIPEN